MGIKGLLKQLETKSTDVAKFMREYFPNYRRNGDRVRAAVDASTWLYRGCFTCATELATSRPTRGYIYFVFKLIRLLRDYGIDVVLVFDGERMPLKKETNESRREVREAARKKGMEALAKSRLCKDKEEQTKLKSEAAEYFKTAIRVTSDLRHKLIKELEGQKIPWIVSPREADPQLAYMVSSRCPAKWKCDMIITEDSDLVVYCVAGHVKSPIMLKLRTSGTCDVVDLKDMNIGFRSARRIQRENDVTSTKNNTKKLSGSKLFMSRLSCMTPRMFVQMCCMSGSDYTNRISNNGMMRSQELIIRFASSNPGKRFEDILYYLRNPNEEEEDVDDNQKSLQENKKPTFTKKKTIKKKKKKKKKEKTPAIIAKKHLSRLKQAEFAFFKSWCYNPILKQMVPFVENAIYDLPSLSNDVNIYDVIGTIPHDDEGSKYPRARLFKLKEEKKKTITSIWTTPRHHQTTMVTEHNNMTATKMKRIEAVEIEDNKDDDFDVIEDCVLVEAVSLYDEGLYEEYSDLIQDSQVEKKQKTKKQRNPFCVQSVSKHERYDEDYSKKKKKKKKDLFEVMRTATIVASKPPIEKTKKKRRATTFDSTKVLKKKKKKNTQNKNKQRSISTFFM